MRRIDPTTWPRATTYALYRAMGAPHLGITADVEVTRLVERCAKENRSLFAATMHILVGAANHIPQLRQRIHTEDGEDVVVEHDTVHPAFTVAVEGGLFNFATVPFTTDPRAFASTVAAASTSQRNNPVLRPFEDIRDDVLYMSCLPWMHFSSMTHPVHTDRPDSVPRIAWGRYTRSGDTVTLPVSIQVHHALVDGSHLGAFFSKVQGHLSSLPVQSGSGA